MTSAGRKSYVIGISSRFAKVNPTYVTITNRRSNRSLGGEGRTAIWRVSPPPAPPHNVADMSESVMAESFAATLRGGGHAPPRERLPEVVTGHGADGGRTAIWRVSPPPAPPHNVADMSESFMARSFAATLRGGGHAPPRERLRFGFGCCKSGCSCPLISPFAPETVVHTLTLAQKTLTSLPRAVNQVLR